MNNLLYTRRTELQKSVLPIILVDMDGIFCDFLAGFYEFANQYDPILYRALPPIREIPHFYIDDCLDDPLLKQRVLDVCNNPYLFQTLPPFPGAIQGMHYLKKAAAEYGVSVMICTSPHITNHSSWSEKARWVELHLGKEWLHDLLVVRDKSVCNGLLLLDDKPTPNGRFEPTWEHVVMDHSYNRDMPAVESKLRMMDWSEKSVDSLIHTALLRGALL